MRLEKQEAPPVFYFWTPCWLAVMREQPTVGGGGLPGLSILSSVLCTSYCVVFSLIRWQRCWREAPEQLAVPNKKGRHGVWVAGRAEYEKRATERPLGVGTTTLAVDASRASARDESWRTSGAPGHLGGSLIVRAGPVHSERLPCPSPRNCIQTLRPLSSLSASFPDSPLPLF